MDDLITNLLKIMIGLVSVVITTYVIPYIKSKANNNKLNNLMTWIEEAVQAAEQIYANEKSGDKKKLYVVNRILDISDKLKFKISEQEVILLLESVVKKMNDKKGQYDE